MKNSLFTRKRTRFSLFIIYLIVSGYFALSYWFISDKPVISPFFAKLQYYIGNIEELPLGERWTSRYTLRVSSFGDTGLIGKSCVVFLPFSLKEEQHEIEVEIRSLVICPGYQTRMTVLINSKKILEQPIDYNWRTFQFPVPKQQVLLPTILSLRFDMIREYEIPEYRDELIAVAYPYERGLKVWEMQEWQQQDARLESGYVSIDRIDDAITINENLYIVQGVPLTIALTRWDSLLFRSLPIDHPLAACRIVRMIN